MLSILPLPWWCLEKTFLILLFLLETANYDKVKKNKTTTGLSGTDAEHRWGREIETVCSAVRKGLWGLGRQGGLRSCYVLDNCCPKSEVLKTLSSVHGIFRSGKTF
jgi:hypothetical protein